MKLEKGNFALPPLDEKGKIHPFSWQKLMLMVQGIDAEKCHYKKRWKSA
jgi:transposase